MTPSGRLLLKLARTRARHRAVQAEEDALIEAALEAGRVNVLPERPARNANLTPRRDAADAWLDRAEATPRRAGRR